MPTADELRAEHQLSEEFEAYCGQWVAVQEQHVIAAAPTLSALLNQIEGTEVEGVLQVPREKATACFF